MLHMWEAVAEGIVRWGEVPWVRALEREGGQTDTGKKPVGCWWWLAAVEKPLIAVIVVITAISQQQHLHYTTIMAENKDLLASIEKGKDLKHVEPVHDASAPKVEEGRWLCAFRYVALHAWSVLMLDAQECPWRRWIVPPSSMKSRESTSWSTLRPRTPVPPRLKVCADALHVIDPCTGAYIYAGDVHVKQVDRKGFLASVEQAAKKE